MLRKRAVFLQAITCDVRNSCQSQQQLLDENYRSLKRKLDDDREALFRERGQIPW